MSLINRTLNAISNKEYSGASELNDGGGLIAKISPKGRITFQYRCRFNGENKRYKIGRYPCVSLKQARQIHQRMMELKDAGRNPQIAVTGETDFITLANCIDFWREEKVKYQKPGTQDIYASFSKNYYYPAFHDMNVETISAREWMSWFDGIAKTSPKTAQAAFSKLRACLNFCKSKFLIDGTNIEKIRQRDVGTSADEGTRVLSVNELAEIWIAIERSRAGTSTKNLHLLTILWGNRLSELRLAQKIHFDMKNDIWIVPAENTKMGNVIRRPITKQIKPLLLRLMNIYDDYLFPGASLHRPITISAANRYIRRLRDTLALPHWRTHDFRRSISTICSEQGAMPHVTERMLGHELVGVMRVYNKHDWIVEQQIAYETFGDALFLQIEKTLEGK